MIRRDIQALRAFAVMAVFVYHMRPELLSGGFAGVDVFFVLSGFLISSHLFHELEKNGKISFSKFWARRAKRLLPASLTVLAASAIGVWFLAPQAFQERFFRDISAASVYFANWVFAIDSVDYLAADNSPSVVQHFWSLGVEEQLYIAWPLLLALVWFIGRRFLSGPRAIAIALSVIAISSLVYSSLLVFDKNPLAYFSTLSRAWEFAAGGLIGLLMLGRQGKHLGWKSLANVSSLAGWAVLGAFVLFFDSAAGFPGLNALVPVVATLLIIGAGDPQGRFTLAPILNLRPIQFLGDASYSIYLWHWPILVFVGFNYSTIPGRVLVLIFFVTIVVAWLSMRFIENPFRFGKLRTSLKPRQVFVGVGVTMLLIVSSTQAASGVIAREIDTQRQASAALEQQLAENVEAQEDAVTNPTAAEKVWDQVSCMGPSFLVEAECSGFVWDSVVPAVAVKEETAHNVEPLERIGSEKGCLAWGDGYELIECIFGVSGGTRIALIGDSHAYHWLPAFAQMAKASDIELHFVARAGCPANALAREANGDHVRGCFSWMGEMEDWITNGEPFETVVIANFSGSRFAGAGEYGARQDAAVEGFKEAWAPITATGAELVIFKDTPFIGEDAWNCVVAHAEDVNRCDVTLSSITSNYDNSAAAGEELGLRILDFTKYFCTDQMCPMGVGGVRVYRDSNHMSGTFNLLMTPYLQKELLG